MRIVIPDNAPPMYPPGGHPTLERLRALGEVALISEPGANATAELARRLSGATVAINVRAYARFTPELFAAVPTLQHVAIIGTGTDNVDLPAATAAGILVTNTPGVTRRSVAEHALALLFACARNIAAHDGVVRAGEWRHLPGIDLQDKTVGVIGLGVIGQEFAKLASAIGMRVVAWSVRHDPSRAAACGAQLLPLEQLLAESHVVSLHLRNTPEMRHWLNADRIQQMRDGVILINTARGALIDDDALAGALRSGKVSMAGLDVYDPEPLKTGHAFRDLPNVVLTPHSAIATPEARDALLEAVAKNVQNWASGNSTNVVNPAVQRA